MKRFKSNQKLLFKAETVFNLKPLEKYEIIFSFLGTSPLEIPSAHISVLKDL